MRLLPYALGFFGICLPVFVMLGVRTPNATWLAVSLGAYGFVWALFYLVVDWLRRTPGAAEDVELRTRIQLAGGLLWAIALFQTSMFAAGAGWLSETLLVLCAGAAAGIIFFASPTLPGLLLIAPVAAAGPILGAEERPAYRLRRQSGGERPCAVHGADADPQPSPARNIFC